MWFAHVRKVLSSNASGANVCSGHLSFHESTKFQSGCSVVIMVSDVSVALQSCVTCGVLSCGRVRATNTTLKQLFHLPFIPNFTPCNFCCNDFHEFQHGNCLVRHVVVRHGNLTSVCDVILMSFLLRLGSSNSLRFNDSLCSHDLALNMKNSIFSFRFFNKDHGVVPSLNGSG